MGLDEDDSGKNEDDIDMILLGDQEPCISVNALSGIQGYQTMRVVGFVGRKPIHILIDSGSTHNFLDLNSD